MLFAQNRSAMLTNSSLNWIGNANRAVLRRPQYILYVASLAELSQINTKQDQGRPHDNLRRDAVHPRKRSSDRQDFKPHD